MTPTVCILAAGRGSRLGQISEYLNKALLPLQDKAAISHIINAFPEETPFVVALGYLGEQIKNYLQIAHPDTQISYVDVDPWEGENSGPGYSLYSCRELLQEPFYFTCADTLWEPTELLPSHYSWIGVSDYPDAHTGRFCNIRANESQLITEVKDKVSVEAVNFKPFIGLGFIKESELFFKALNEKKTINGEVQISSGFTSLVEKKKLYVHNIASWYDIGTEELYRSHLSKMDGFDFSKDNEAFYHVGDKVIKFFADPNKPSRLIDKIQVNETPYPANTNLNENFFWYPFVEGSSLYESHSKVNFESFLNVCEDFFWQPLSIEKNEFKSNLTIFYEESLVQRFNEYNRKYGQNIKFEDTHLKSINWENIYRYSKPCRFHGDLQFDNVILNTKGDFVFIDPRDLFGLTTQYGDQLYDLTKMYAGFLINFSQIRKQGIDHTHRIEKYADLRLQLKKYCQRNSIPFELIVFLAGIVFLRMAPLHRPPFCHQLFKKGYRITKRLAPAVNQI